MRTRLTFLLPIAFFIGIFLLSIIPLNDYDIWFHLKSGEIIAQKGIIRYDVFSYNTAGREWFPYEWLFQISMYAVKTSIGLRAIPYVIAGIICLWMTAFFLIFRNIFRLSRWWSVTLTFFFYVSVYEFFSARPHVFAYTFLTINCFLILLYVYRNKNLLWLTIPITLAWTNLHGSIFLDVYFFGAYAVIACIHWLKTKEKRWRQKVGTLGFFAVLTAVLTVLPPLGTIQYRLLWIFFTNNKFISTFIDEWTPLITNQFAFVFVSTTVAIVVLLILATLIQKKGRTGQSILVLVPALPFFLLPYMASRNVVLGYIAITCCLAWLLKEHIDSQKKFLTIAAILIVLIHGWILADKRTPQTLYYPARAVQFIKRTDLAGHIFNEYGYGGYLLYHLYPKQKVFFDGRTDLYLCCEMPDTLKLATNKYQDDAEYKKTTDWLWSKYDISFVLVSTRKHSVLRKIARLLTADPDWSLVYWDDQSQIFVRHNGKNDNVLEQYAVWAATPYDKNPYKNDTETQAMAEYQQMLEVADSARTRNAIGFLLLKQDKIDQAKTEFEKAIALDPAFESPYMNIAEIAAAKGDSNTAIYLYLEALKRAPDRGLIYIRLGQLYRDIRDMKSAMRVWQTGIEKTVDTDAKEKLKNLFAQ